MCSSLHKKKSQIRASQFLHGSSLEVPLISQAVQQSVAARQKREVINQIPQPLDNRGGLKGNVGWEILLNNWLNFLFKSSSTFSIQQMKMGGGDGVRIPDGKVESHRSEEVLLA